MRATDRGRPFAGKARSYDICEAHFHRTLEIVYLWAGLIINRGIEVLKPNHREMIIVFQYSHEWRYPLLSFRAK